MKVGQTRSATRSAIGGDFLLSSLSLVATKLDKVIRRELEIDGEFYTVSISPDGVKIVPKGRRKGHEITWRTLLSGDAELAEQLNISVDALKR